MTDFIEIYDDALSPDLCQAIINTFDQSPHRTPGRTCGGVDPSKKISTDLYLNQHPEYHAAMNEICRLRKENRDTD